MPIRLKPVDLTADLEHFKSVLIVSCPMCPAASMAMLKKKPFIEFFKYGFKTQALEDYIASVREALEQRGIRTDAFTMRLPHPLMCLWTAGQRRRLLKRARAFEAALVLGCYSAAHTARVTLKDTDCRVFQGMKEVGLANATVRVRYPMTVELDTHDLSDRLFTRRKDSTRKAAISQQEVP
ncbi:MAG: hypothetical protein ACR2PG_20140 [Hyphomicrobiaceae bacterium]